MGKGSDSAAGVALDVVVLGNVDASRSVTLDVVVVGHVQASRGETFDLVGVIDGLGVSGVVLNDMTVVLP